VLLLVYYVASKAIQWSLWRIFIKPNKFGFMSLMVSDLYKLKI